MLVPPWTDGAKRKDGEQRCLKGNSLKFPIVQFLKEPARAPPFVQAFDITFDCCAYLPMIRCSNSFLRP